MGNRFKSGFVALIIFSVAVLLMAAVAYAQAQGGLAGGCGDGVCMNVGCLALNCAAPETWENCPQDCPASCSDGFKNQDEAGVDCGGVCLSPTILEVCDGWDNNKDCLVDFNCTPKFGIGSGGAVAQPVSPLPSPKQPEASCYDGFRNQDEVGDDCGGVCVTNATELCDSKDNDKDCLVDEGDACLSAPKTTPQPAPEVIPATPMMPEVMPTPEPVAAPVPAPEPQSEPATPTKVPATSALEVPAVGGVDVASLTDEQIDAFIEQNGGADFISQMRKLAAEKGVYVPKGESDAQFGRKYVGYFFKHQSELAAKFEGKESTEDELVGILKQFSEETYPRPVQQQSFFSKVAGFFKRLFG